MYETVCISMPKLTYQYVFYAPYNVNIYRLSRCIYTKVYVSLRFGY